MTSPELAGEQPVDYDYYLDTYGLGPEEVSSTITFGNHTGTVAQMLNDERCPVGNIVADAYKAEGVAGVEAKLTGLGMLDSSFDLKISESTRSYHAGSSTRETLLVQAPVAEKPDFLA